MATNQQQPQLWAGGIAQNYFKNKYGYTPKLNNQNGNITADNQPIYKAPNVINGKTMIGENEVQALQGAMDKYAQNIGIAAPDAQTSPLYQSLEKRAMSLGRAGAGDVMAQRSAQTWGMPNSDAVTRGNEVYQKYINDAVSYLPQIQDMYNNQAATNRNMLAEQQQRAVDNAYRNNYFDWTKNVNTRDFTADQKQKSIQNQQWKQGFDAENNRFNKNYSIDLQRLNQANATIDLQRQGMLLDNEYKKAQTDALKTKPATNGSPNEEDVLRMAKNMLEATDKMTYTNLYDPTQITSFVMGSGLTPEAKVRIANQLGLPKP